MLTLITMSSEGKPSSIKMKQRRSIDQEFHDLLDDSAHYSVTTEARRWIHQPQHPNEASKGQLSIGSSEVSDGDSFGEASVNSQPDQQYLHELLDDEYHPERVNLLDNTTKPSNDDDASSAAPRLKTKNGIKIRNYSDHNDDDVSISSVDEDENDVGSKYEGSSSKFGSSWNSSWWSESEPPDDLGDSIIASPASAVEQPEQRIPRLQKMRNLQIDDDDSEVEFIRNGKGELVKGGTKEESAPENSEGADEYEEVDGFNDSPSSRKPSSYNSRGSTRSFGSRSRPKMLKDSLQTMGKSTKKSLRTINGKTFWSQPFKGLAVSRNRRSAKKGSAPTSTADPEESPS